MQGTVPSWQRCNFDIPYTRDIKSSIRYHLDLTARGYRSLIYSGDHDMIIPFIGTQAWIRSLNFSVVDEWRPWFVDGQVAGWGHTVFIDTIKLIEYVCEYCVCLWPDILSVCLMCRYTRSYSNNLTFATVKVCASVLASFKGCNTLISWYAWSRVCLNYSQNKYYQVLAMLKFW